MHYFLLPVYNCSVNSLILFLLYCCVFQGKYYMFIEQFVQFYRCLVAVRPWLNYLADFNHGGQTLSVILLLVYCFCKVSLHSCVNILPQGLA